MQSLIGFILDLSSFTYNSANMKILHTSNINLLTMENTAYLIENNDFVNTNIVSISNQNKSSEPAIKGVFVAISL